MQLRNRVLLRGHPSLLEDADSLLVALAGHQVKRQDETAFEFGFGLPYSPVGLGPPGDGLSKTSVWEDLVEVDVKVLNLDVRGIYFCVKNKLKKQDMESAEKAMEKGGKGIVNEPGTRRKSNKQGVRVLFLAFGGRGLPACCSCVGWDPCVGAMKAASGQVEALYRDMSNLDKELAFEMMVGNTRVLPDLVDEKDAYTEKEINYIGNPRKKAKAIRETFNQFSESYDKLLEVMFSAVKTRVAEEFPNKLASATSQNVASDDVPDEADQETKEKKNEAERAGGNKQGVRVLFLAELLLLLRGVY
eukprot:g3207.t1